VVVDAAGAGADRLGDVGHADRVVAALGDELGGCREDGLAEVLVVSASGHRGRGEIL
jgi:hypothetical protein